MAFPATVDNLTGIVDAHVDGGVWVHGSHWAEAIVNPWIDEINAITSTLGVNPQGAYATVVARLNAIEVGTGEHTLLDGTYHTDTVEHIPASGDIIYGRNVSLLLPVFKWDTLAIGDEGQILAVSGSLLPEWVDHDHSKEFAAVSHTHDDRYFTETEVTNGFAAIGHLHTGVYSPVGHDHAGVYSPVGHDHAGVYAPVSHAHAAGDITSGQIGIAYGGTGAGSFTGDGEFVVWDETSNTLMSSGFSGASFASASHAHDAEDITSGVLPIDYGGTGASTYTADKFLYFNTANGAIEASTYWYDSFALAGHNHNTTYLALDCSNDPLTNNLSIDTVSQPYLTFYEGAAYKGAIGVDASDNLDLQSGVNIVLRSYGVDVDGTGITDWPNVRVNGGATSNPYVEFTQAGVQKGYVLWLHSENKMTYYSVSGEHLFNGNASCAGSLTALGGLIESRLSAAYAYVVIRANDAAGEPGILFRQDSATDKAYIIYDDRGASTDLLTYSAPGHSFAATADKSTNYMVRMESLLFQQYGSTVDNQIIGANVWYSNGWKTLNTGYTSCINMNTGELIFYIGQSSTSADAGADLAEALRLHNDKKAEFFGTIAVDHIAEKTASHEIVLDNHARTLQHLFFTDDLYDTWTAGRIELRGDETADVTMYLHSDGVANPTIYMAKDGQAIMSMFYDYLTAYVHIYNASSAIYALTATYTGKVGVNDSAPSITFTVSAKAGITDEGGFAVKVTAGEALSRGNVVYVKIASGADGKVFKTIYTDSESIQMPVGVVYAAASADADVWIVTSGIAYVLPESGITAARGNVLIVSNAEHGVVEQSATVPTTEHWRECGHWLDTGSGNGALTRAFVHFN